MRAPSKGGEKNWEGSMKACEVEREGPGPTREVRDTLPGAGQSLSCSSRSHGRSTGPRSKHKIKGKLGLIKGVNTN